DTHIYHNHMEMVKKILSREPFPLPKLVVKKEVGSYEDMTKLEWKDFALEGYQYHPPIKAPMAV
ncbi:MAG: thymidylate synthase, partial [Bacteroidota bacterium]